MRTLGAFILVFSVGMHGQQMRPSPMEEVGRDNLPSNELGPDDLIAISVYDAPELTRTVRIEPDGSVHLPMLHGGITAAGLRPGELEKSIGEALVEEKLLVDPYVKVTVAEYHSRPISVVGAVHKPLTFQAVGTVTLLDALARAEGLTAEAGSEILVSRQHSQAGVVDRVTVKRLFNEADPAVNFVLHGGEEIRVPEAGKIVVVGNVRKPGAYVVKDSFESSVLRLVALSEGLMPFAGKEAYIYRRDDTGTKQEIPVKLDQILQRKSPDVTLLADDVFYVPDNRGRRMTMTVIERMTNFGSSTASGLLIWR